MKEIFRFNKNSVYSIRSGIQLEKPSINTVQFGSESTVYLEAKIQELIPENMKSSESVDIFKNKNQKIGTRNWPMPTMQNISQSGWFCKLIASCWSPLLPILSELTKKSFYKNTVYNCKKKLLTFVVFYSFINLFIYLFITSALIIYQHQMFSIYLDLIILLYYLYFGAIAKLK